ncbi:ATP-binding cassette domain-containing protein [Oricola cellulosilytica]|uniref:ATP-binding cassette domain-containing protein n=1 Tax=Oricola cellulosilytica TaxID=1429082 RepID=A0A4R0P4W1_9HYPH|nr:ATP-binding cassette domain-containing protein [Oricola cellulosilytica]TCD11903.1 ATP-binding cassette domain-containing protein [Oricola cellulosilytica]
MLRAVIDPPAPAAPEGAASTRLRTRNIVLKIDGKSVLDGVTLDFDPDRLTVIMGPNGAGKSLLLRILHGLLKPTGGEVSWGGGPAGPPRQAMVFQKPVLLRRSVAANIDYVLPKSECRDGEECAGLLARVGLAHKARQAARLLSGGEQQRLALARALATKPEALFLDEPTASLDPPSVLMIEQLVKEIQSTGTKVLFVTHDVAQARRLADDVVFLHRGCVTDHAPAADFFGGACSPVAADFLAGKIVI